MKNKIILALAIFMLALVGLMTVNFTDVLAKDETVATGHVVRDTLDQVWRCVGTPRNCATS